MVPTTNIISEFTWINGDIAFTNIIIQKRNGQKTTELFNNNNKWSKQFVIRPHRSRRWTVQSYSPRGTNMPSHERTWQCWHHLANTLNLYFLWCTQVHNPNGKSINSAILHSLQKKVPVPYNGRPFPQSCPFPSRNWTASNTWFLGPIWAHNPNGISMSSAILAQMTADCLHILQWDAPFPPPNCPFPWGNLNPHLIHGSLGPPKSSTQTASRLL